MVKLLFSVRDKKAGFNGAIAMYDNEALAIRDFSNLVKEPSTLHHKYPEDFDLVKIGSFDTETGLLAGLTEYEVVAKATSFSDVRNEVKTDVISDTVQEN